MFIVASSLAAESRRRTPGCEFLQRNIFTSTNVFNATVFSRVTNQSRRPFNSLVDADLILFFFFPFSIYMLSLPKNSLAALRPSEILISLALNGNVWSRELQQPLLRGRGGLPGWFEGQRPEPLMDTWRRVQDCFPTWMTRPNVLLRPRGATGWKANS